ncbi:hypothetical protein ENSA5_25980 [Enhygromyxa salina]|uniref:Lipoprotein n=1 Tax=Enhygromyxa salina TaxID=215803 RepID=A0A2S9YAL2_9BACT|nr:hypothetical protein [Enhygromyxa salina]PRQ02139.1 hypothetical protein ENSA5_25980 [Enhygromyxa salina]
MSMFSPRNALFLTLCSTPCLAVTACTDDAQPADGGSEDAGQDPHATFTVDFDATTICGAAIDRVEFATRRRDCFDPELPCTMPANPPWITGTSVDCSDIAGSMNWEVEVTQTGKYETQLRAFAGDTQEGIHCFAAGGEPRTKVANVDLEMFATFAVTEVDDSECDNP